MNRNSWATVAAILLLALAVLFHAAAQRYETTQAGRLVLTTDRLTGRRTVCRITTGNALDCAAHPPPPDLTQP